MLYLLLNHLSPFSIFLIPVFAVLTMISIALYLALAGSSIRRQAHNSPRVLNRLRIMISICLIFFVLSTGVWILKDHALISTTTPQPAFPLMDIIVGGPPDLDRRHLLKFGGILLIVCLISNGIVLSQLKTGSAFRLWLDRFRAIPRTQDQQGSSHFATVKEYRRFRLTKPHGITFYGKFFGQAMSKTKFTYLGDLMSLSVEDSARGILAVGNPGSGKTSSVILPVIYDTMQSGQSLVVADPQNELTKHILRYARATEYRVTLHNPLHPKSPRFNLADQVDSVSTARAIADVLIPARAGDADGFWNLSAAMLLAACLLRFDNLGDIFASFHDLRALGDTLDQPDDAGRLAAAFINSTRSDLKLATNIVATLSTSLSAWADTDVCLSTTSSDFSARQLLSDKPTVIILACPGAHRRALAPYLGAVLTRLLRDLDAHAEHGHNHPIRFILDEFPSLGNLSGVVEAVNMVRKRHISILIAVQTLGQLHLLYGRHGTDVLLSGMAFQVVFGGCDQSTAEFYSRVTGTTTSKADGTKKQPPRTEARKLLTPDEMVRPPQGNCTIFGRYVTHEYATYVIILARLTRIYEREDVRVTISTTKNKRLQLLKRSSDTPPIRSTNPLATPLCSLESLNT